MAHLGVPSHGLHPPRNETVTPPNLDSVHISTHPYRPVQTYSRFPVEINNETISHSTMNSWHIKNGCSGSIDECSGPGQNDIYKKKQMSDQIISNQRSLSSPMSELIVPVRRANQQIESDNNKHHIHSLSGSISPPGLPHRVYIPERHPDKYKSFHSNPNDITHAHYSSVISQVSQQQPPQSDIPNHTTNDIYYTHTFLNGDVRRNDFDDDVEKENKGYVRRSTELTHDTYSFGEQDREDDFKLNNSPMSWKRFKFPLPQDHYQRDSSYFSSVNCGDLSSESLEEGEMPCDDIITNQLQQQDETKQLSYHTKDNHHNRLHTFNSIYPLNNSLKKKKQCSHSSTISYPTNETKIGSHKHQLNYGVNDLNKQSIEILPNDKEITTSTVNKMIPFKLYPQDTGHTTQQSYPSTYDNSHDNTDQLYDLKTHFKISSSCPIPTTSVSTLYGQHDHSNQHKFHLNTINKNINIPSSMSPIQDPFVHTDTKKPVVIMCQVPATGDALLKKQTPLRAPPRRSMIPRKPPHPPTTGFVRDNPRPNSRYFKHVYQFHKDQLKRCIKNKKKQEFELIPLKNENTDPIMIKTEELSSTTMMIPEQVDIVSSHNSEHHFIHQQTSRALDQHLEHPHHFTDNNILSISHSPPITLHKPSCDTNTHSHTTHPLTYDRKINNSMDANQLTNDNFNKKRRIECHSEILSPMASAPIHVTFTSPLIISHHRDNHLIDTVWWNRATQYISVSFGTIPSSLTPDIVGTYTCDWLWSILTSTTVWEDAAKKAKQYYLPLNPAQYNSQLSQHTSFNPHDILYRVIFVLTEIIKQIESTLYTTVLSQLHNKSNTDRLTIESRIMFTFIKEVLRLWIQGCYKKLLEGQQQQQQQQLVHLNPLLHNGSTHLLQPKQSSHDSMISFITSTRLRHATSTKLQECWNQAQQLSASYCQTHDLHTLTTMTHQNKDIISTPTIKQSLIDPRYNIRTPQIILQALCEHKNDICPLESPSLTPLPKRRFDIDSDIASQHHRDIDILLKNENPKKKFYALRRAIMTSDQQVYVLDRKRHYIETMTFQIILKHWISLLSLQTLKSYETFAKVRRTLRSSLLFPGVAHSTLCPHCDHSTNTNESPSYSVSSRRRRRRDTLDITTQILSQKDSYHVSPYHRFAYRSGLRQSSSRLSLTGSQLIGSTICYCSHCGKHYPLLGVQSYSFPVIDQTKQQNETNDSQTHRDDSHLIDLSSTRFSIGRHSMGRLSLLSLNSNEPTIMLGDETDLNKYEQLDTFEDEKEPIICIDELIPMVSLHTQDATILETNVKKEPMTEDKCMIALNTQQENQSIESILNKKILPIPNTLQRRRTTIGYTLRLKKRKDEHP